MALENQEKRIAHVKALNRYLREELQAFLRIFESCYEELVP